MRKKRKGKIINISSIAGIIAVPYQGFYSASKFAIEGYSEALAMEVYPFNIKICIVEPGDFNTGFTANRNISSPTLDSTDYGACFTNTLKIIEEAENKWLPSFKVNQCHLPFGRKEKSSFPYINWPMATGCLPGAKDVYRDH